MRKKPGFNVSLEIAMKTKFCCNNFICFVLFCFFENNIYPEPLKIKGSETRGMELICCVFGKREILGNQENREGMFEQNEFLNYRWVGIWIRSLKKL